MLEKSITELKKHMPIKMTSAPGDIVIVGMESGLCYGVLRTIEQDVKKGWFRVDCTLLVIPPADLSWILRPSQINGEIFTINKKEHFILPVDIGGTHDKTSYKGPSEQKRLLRLVKKEGCDTAGK